ncbi:hypothetical protein [Corynebacterium sp. NML120713]|uniref:hypothetical protein n=1 Tax=Corynebacterium sp. NML120713 TaxID=1906332 RepID=UPI000914C7E6|nr:hypothetical protein [Corynebacterium sp. NML120713]OIR43510.1 hypothetical protein BJP06_05900 [Corynebacterium sp. NML120713]
MAGLIAGVMAVSTANVVAPNASADIAVTSEYDRLSPEVEQQVREEQALWKERIPHGTNALGLLPTQYGPGWCIDWGVDNPWNNPAGYEYRKLTGQSGRYGEGNRINKDVEKGAIYLMRSVMEDQKRGDTASVTKKMNYMQALLSNNLGYLNDIRPKLMGDALFTQLTGFEIRYRHVDKNTPGPNYYLMVNEEAMAKIRKEVSDDAYIVVLMPKNYNLNLSWRREYTSQRLIIPSQPGLEKPKTPKPQPPAPKYTNTTVTLPKSTITTVTRVPEATVTKWKKFPPKTVETTTTLAPSVTTETVTPEASTYTTTVRKNGEPITTTRTTKPEPYITTREVPGKEVKTTTTITESPVVTTVKEHTTPTTLTEYTTVPTTVEVTPSDVTETETAQSTTTTTSTNVNVKEIIREYETQIIKEVHEIHNTIDIRHKDEKKILDLGDLKKQGYSWRITRGGDLVIVDRDKNNNLIIKPKDGFKGSGVVEIVVTDENGNEYIYELQINDRTGEIEHLNKIVNNYFYNINQGGSDRTKLIKIEKGDKWDLLKGGDIAKVEDDGAGHIVVTPKDKNVQGEVRVKVTSKDGVEKENIITIENFNSTYKVTREIADTSVGYVERRGGTKYEITSDVNKVIKEIVKDGDNWRIVPNEGSEGEAHVTFIDENGRKYEFTFIVKKDPNAGPDIRDVIINHDGKVEIDKQDKLTAKIVGNGTDYATLTEEDGKWVIKPTEAAANASDVSKVVVQVHDEKGELRGVWNIQINPARNADSLDKETRSRDVIDRSLMTIRTGDEKNNNLRIVEGQDLIIPEGEEKKNANGDITDMRFRFKPGSEGTVRVQETIRWYSIDDQNQPKDHGNAELAFPDLVGDKIKHDPNNGDKPYVELVVTEWVVNVKPGEVKELKHDITTDNDMAIQGTNLKLVKGEELLQSKPEDGSTMDLKPLRNANGEVVVENRTKDGYIFERYTFNLKPGRDTNKTIKRTLTTDGVAKLARYEGDKIFKLLDGTIASIDSTGATAEGKSNLTDITDKMNEFFEVSEQGSVFAVKPKESAVGKTFTFQVADDRGVYANYVFTVGAGDGKGARTLDLPETSEFRALEINPNTMVWASGAENFETKTVDSGSVNNEGQKLTEWVAKPKAGTAGKSGVVQEIDPNGNVVARYTLNIKPGKQRKYKEVNTGALVGQDVEFAPADSKNTFAVTKGADLVSTSTKEGKFVVTPKPAAAHQTIVIEERDPNGDLVTKYNVSVLPQGWSTSQGANIADPNKLFKITRGKNGQIIIEKDPNAKFDIDFGKLRFDIIGGNADVKFENGKWIITPTQSGNITIVPQLPSGNAASKIDINVQVEQSGSSNANFKDPKCIAGLVGMASPLLLLIPLGILSQVRIPGLESLRAQVNAAIKRANDDIQRGLGIYDHDRAQTAAGLQGAFQVANPQMIGLAGGALGAITAGLIIMDVVLRSCGVDEATSSYQLGKATGNQTLIDGSSKKDNPATTEAKPSEETKPADKK